MRICYYILLIFLLTIPVTGYCELVINEVCSNNDTVISDYYGDFSDWIELKNTSTTVISLHSYCLSDNPTSLHKFRFPTGTVINPNQIIMVWGEHDSSPRPTNIADSLGEYHTSFSIKAEGEPVILSLYSTNVIVDQCPAVALDDDISYGRIGTGTTWYYFPEPTPRAENTTSGYSTLLSPPVPNHASGWYADPLYVNFTAPDLGAVVRYTTDGSIPDIDSPVWTGGVELHERSSDPNVYCLIPTVLPNHEGLDELDAWYPPNGNVPKIHNIRVRSFSSAGLPSNTVSRSYLIGTNLTGLPLVSVTVDHHDLFSASDGIYVAGNGYDGNFLHANFMQNWSRAANVQWFNSAGTLLFEKECEAEIHGTYSARAGQKSLRIKAAATSGDTDLNYAFYGSEYLDHFYQLILRNGGNDVHWTMFRDNLVHAILKQHNLDTSNYQPCLVFLDGEFWGIHIMQENMEEHYVSNHYNIPLTDLDVLESESHAICGTDDDYENFVAWLTLNDPSDPAVWQAVTNKFDLDNCTEYYAGEIIAGNDSWPSHNIRYWRKRVPYTPNAPYGQDGRYRWLVYDMDYCFGLRHHPCWTHETLWDAINPDEGWRTQFLRLILQNNDFKNNFINTIADRLNYDWQPTRILPLIDQFASQFSASMPAQIQRWSMPANYSTWQADVDTLRSFTNHRPAWLRNNVVQLLGLRGTAIVHLQISPAGAATVTINNRINVTAGDYVYFQDVPIKLKAILPQDWEIVDFGGQSTANLSLTPAATQTINLTVRQKVPSNLHIRCTGNSIYLSWDTLSGAISYKVETAQTPDSATWVNVANTLTSHATVPVNGTSSFYRVIAVY